MPKMAALQNTQHVSEFSPDGKLFACINAEGKLKIWDTEENQLKQEYIPNLHLSAPCTCFTWITATASDTSAATPNGNAKSKKFRKSITDHNATSLYIAMGTAKGGIVLYSYATGKIEKTLKGNGHSGGVTSICRGENADTLYTSGGEDCRIIGWSLSAGAQRSNTNWKTGNDVPTCLVHLRKSNQLMMGARELKLWSLDDHDQMQLYAGHTSAVNILQYVQIEGHEYVLSTSKMDRTISMWRIKTGEKYKNAVATFLMADVAFYLSCIVTGEQLQVSAVTRSGVVHLFIVNDISKISSTKPIKPKITIEIASDTTDTVEPIPIVTATLNLSAKDQTILVGYGDRQSLHFEQIEYSNAEKNQVLIRADPKKSITVQHKLSATAKERALKLITPITDGSVEYQTPTTLGRKTKSIEMPMEARLENLSLGKTPDATKNVAQLLVQGLHNHDATLLKNVFTTTDEKVIRSTLQRLPPQYVTSLVTELTLLTQKKTSNVQLAVVWLKLIVQTHASQLMALGSNTMYSQFGPLLGIIEHRANNMQHLTKLSGRLDLLMGQIKRNDDDDDENTLNNANMIVFEDSDSSNSDVEAPNNDSSSDDDQWEEEDESDYDTEKMDVSDNDMK